MSADRTDVCIIGAGGAGICLALELAGRGVSSVLVTGGTRREQERHRDLYRGDVSPAGSHEPLESSRVRAHGGSTVRWGGRCVPYDAVDFDAREYLDFAGWPIGWDELAPYGPRAAEYCVIEGTQFEYDGSACFPEAFEEEISVRRVERWSPPVNFAEHYAKELAGHELIEVLVDWHLVDLRSLPGEVHVDRAVVRNWGGDERELRAERFVLAAGGLETARILLNLRERHPSPYGRVSPQLGRNYMGHLMGQYGTLELNDPGAIDLFSFWREGQAYVRRRFWLRPEVQEREGVMNAIAFPYRPAEADPAHGDPALSLLYLFKNSRKALGPGGRVGAHLRNILLGRPRSLRESVAQMIRRFGPWRTRLPFILPTRYEAKLALWVQSEHAPHGHSRVELAEGTDPFGWKRLRVTVGFGEIDRRTMTTLYRTLKERLIASGVGDLHYTEEGLEEFLTDLMQNYSSNSHHIGTARMADDPANGVVDRNCRVHGIENLYVCGSATFPTSSHANPTYLVIMMAMRLATHLGDERGRG